MEEIIYKIGGRKRPVNSRYVRILYLLMHIPYIRKYVCALIKRYYKMPASVAIYPGFNCSSSMIQVGENTGLGNLKIIAFVFLVIGVNLIGYIISFIMGFHIGKGKAESEKT